MATVATHDDDASVLTYDPLVSNANGPVDALAAVIRGRRTALRMDPDRPVDPAMIAELCELATWAPNHKRLEPWRFAVLTGNARAQLGRLTAEHQLAQGETDPERLAKSQGKYLRSPVVVVVGAIANTQPVLHAENRDAVAAAVQNFLLGATARGLHSYWGTGTTTHAPEVKRLVGLAQEDTIVAIVYLGWPLGPVDVPMRHPPLITWLDET